MQDLIFKEQPAMLQKLQTLSQTATADQGIAYLKTLLAGYAKTLGLDAKTFQTCLDQKTHSAAIDQQTLDAIDYGVNEPPSFFINSQFQSGLVTYDQFKTIIDAELKK
jgi:protein-disulfide isomerase